MTQAVALGEAERILDALLPLAFEESWHPVRSLEQASHLPDGWWAMVQPLMTSVDGHERPRPEVLAYLHTLWQTRFPHRYRDVAIIHANALMDRGDLIPGIELLLSVGAAEPARRRTEAWLNDRIRAGEFHIARDLLHVLPDDAWDIRVKAAAAVIRLHGGNPESAAAVRQDLQALFDAGERDGRFMYTLAYAFQLDGQYERALGLTEQAIRGDVEGHDQVTLLQLQSVLLGYLGRLDEQVATSRALIAAARSEHDLYFESVGLASLGYALEDLGDLPAAEEQYRQAVRLMQRLGQGPQQATLLNNWAQSLTLAHRPLEALRRLDQAAALQGLHVRHHGWLAVSRASLHHKNGDHVAAVREARRARRLLSEAHLPGDEQWACRIEAEACAATGDLKGAAEAAGQAQDIAAASPSDEAGLAMTLGVIKVLGGTSAEARTAFENVTAGDLHPWDQARLQLYLLDIDLQQGRPPDTASLADTLRLAGGDTPLRTDLAHLTHARTWLLGAPEWRDRTVKALANTPDQEGVPLHLDLLGPLQGFGPEGPLNFRLRRALELLAVLVLQGPQSRAQLMARLWEEVPDMKLIDVFKKTLKALRDTLKPLLPPDEDAVIVEGGLYHLNPHFLVSLPWLPPACPTKGVRVQGRLLVRGPFASDANGPWADDLREEAHRALYHELDARVHAGEVDLADALAILKGLT